MGRRHLLEFIIAVQSYTSEHDDLKSAESMVEDAMAIYDRYFSMQAPEQLDFGDEVRIEIESNICTESGQPYKSAFEQSKQRALAILHEV